MAVKGYEDLLIWQKGIELAKEIYRIVGKLPSSEKFGLASQLQRAAVSVPSNIAEGQSRRNTREFRQFLYQALGSLAELDTQLILARELGYLKAGESEVAHGRVRELRRMTHALVNRLPAIRPSKGGVLTGHRPPATGH